MTPPETPESNEEKIYRQTVIKLANILMDRGGISFVDLKDTQKGKWAIEFLKSIGF